MSYAKVSSRCNVNGLADTVCVEVQLRDGNNVCNIIGLPSTQVKESIGRVNSAIVAAGFAMPEKQITINLTPATIPKHGSHLDLAIALAILIASKQLKLANSNIEVFGELGLNGQISGNLGFLSLFYGSWQARSLLIYPKNLEPQVKYFQKINAIACANLKECVQLLAKNSREKYTVTEAIPEPKKHEMLFPGVRGQCLPKRALTIAAAGGHHVLMIGAPGTGKSLLARSMQALLPDLSQEQALAAMCYSGSAPTLTPNFRAPHHSISMAGLVGGGLPIQAGEITKAHMGLLFTDELTEYSKQTIEMLREPVEKGQITIVRSGESCTLPCQFQWIAALNPCPCGMYGHPDEQCRCNFSKRQAYINKLSNPLLDRFAIACKVSSSEQEVGQCHFSFADINRARKMQEKLWHCCNQRLTPLQMQKIKICPDAKIAYEYLTQKLAERQKQQIVKVALTISYLEAQTKITKKNILEAFSYLPKKIVAGYLT